LFTFQCNCVPCLSIGGGGRSRVAPHTSAYDYIGQSLSHSHLCVSLSLSLHRTKSVSFSLVCFTVTVSSLDKVCLILTCVFHCHCPFIGQSLSHSHLCVSLSLSLHPTSSGVVLFIQPMKLTTNMYTSCLGGGIVAISHHICIGHYICMFLSDDVFVVMHICCIYFCNK
jgi:hypothetical protein